MKDREHKNHGAFNPKNDTVIANPQFPVAFQRTTEGFSK
jgi:hypothetical protein